jgi:hypothetical protein
VGALACARAREGDADPQRSAARPRPDAEHLAWGEGRERPRASFAGHATAKHQRVRTIFALYVLMIATGIVFALAIGLTQS